MFFGDFMRKRYDKLLEKIVDEIKEKKEKPSLLLHSCCAPCSSYVLEYLSKYFIITVLYYNPNISPYSEYVKRKEEQKKLIQMVHYPNEVSIMDVDYDNEVYLEKIKGLEQEPERGRRCNVCYLLRMEKAALMASLYQMDYFCTTLSVSPYKDAELINEIGKQLEEKYEVAFLPADFKKSNGYKRSIELSSQYHLYRQNYCGCIYSKRERKAIDDKKRGIG